MSVSLCGGLEFCRVGKWNFLMLEESENGWETDPGVLKRLDTAVRCLVAGTGTRSRRLALAWCELSEINEGNLPQKFRDDLVAWEAALFKKRSKILDLNILEENTSYVDLTILTMKSIDWESQIRLSDFIFRLYRYVLARHKDAKKYDD